MPFMHRFCCCEDGCTGTEPFQCSQCSIDSALQFRVVSSGITACPCVPWDPDYFSMASTFGDPNGSQSIRSWIDTQGVNGSCFWSGGAPNGSPVSAPLYNEASCTTFDSVSAGTVDIQWFLQRTATHWVLEGYVTGGGGGLQTFIWFSGSTPADADDCFVVPAAISNTLTTCGATFTTGMFGVFPYIVCGTGGQATLTCEKVF